MNEDDALALARRMLLEESKDPLRVLELCHMAMDEVGKSFEAGDYFLPELVLAGEMLETVGAIAKPLLTDAGAPVQRPDRRRSRRPARQNIVPFMLDINDDEVKDIGVDVPVSRFGDEVCAAEPDIVALSGFLTLAFDSMKQTVATLEAAGLHSRVKVVVSGDQVDETVRSWTGADAFGVNAVAAVNLCNGWMGVPA